MWNTVQLVCLYVSSSRVTDWTDHSLLIFLFKVQVFDLDSPLCLYKIYLHTTFVYIFLRVLPANPIFNFLRNFRITNKGWKFRQEGSYCFVFGSYSIIFILIFNFIGKDSIFLSFVKCPFHLISLFDLDQQSQEFLQFYIDILFVFL